MKLQNVFFVTIFALALISCGKDDGPTAATNGAPTMSAQAFTASESISDTQAIGTVEASDPDGDDLAFAIVTNSGDLFEIAATTGSLSLKEGKSLDFNTAASHAITVGVSDGEEEASAQITINVTDVESAPVMENQEFSVDEDVDEATVIYAVVASDADGDALTFAIETNDNDLFEITEAGEISLADGKNLDFETTTKHAITVSVTDGETAVTAEISISVENVADTLAEDPASFVTKWKTDADGQEIVIHTAGKNGFDSDEFYDYVIDWGDGTSENIITGDEQTHIYDKAGIYTVAIKGKFAGMENYIQPKVILDRLISLEQWGDIEWKIFYGIFGDCTNLINNAEDVPNLSEVKNMEVAFIRAENFDGDLSEWNVENVNDMTATFAQTSSFNGDISGWDTGSVAEMDSMFRENTAFNQDLSGWDTGSVLVMDSMFRDATAFNQDLGGWDISNVGNMENMLSNSGMSPENYSATLVGWANAAEEDIPDNIELGAVGLTFCNNPATLTAKTVLIGQNAWTIQDEGSVDCD